MLTSRLNNYSIQSYDLSNEIAFLSLVLKSGEYRAVEPFHFKTALEKIHPEYVGNRQHDVHELLVKILDRIEKELAIEQKNQKVAVTECIQNADNLIEDLFVGQWKTELKCISCSATSVTNHPFRFLHLPVPQQKQSVMLIELLENMSIMEEIDYRCSSKTCTSTKAVKRMMMSKMPNILVIQIKRFGTDESVQLNQRRKVFDLQTFKIYTPVIVPYQLVFERKLYRLICVANHEGSLGSGHYTAQCLDRTDSNCWHMFNDTTSSKSHHIDPRNAYVLFYECIGLDMSGNKIENNPEPKQVFNNETETAVKEIEEMEEFKNYENILLQNIAGSPFADGKNNSEITPGKNVEVTETINEKSNEVIPNGAEYPSSELNINTNEHNDISELKYISQLLSLIHI